VQEVSTATAETQFGAPIISTREASTRLFARDGQTVVIGGLIDRQHEQTRSGIPVLKDIPVLGVLFGSREDRSIRSELFLFLTPHILETDEDMDRAREGVEQEAELLRERLPRARTIVPPRAVPPPAPPDTAGVGERGSAR